MTGATMFSGILAPEVAMPWVTWKWCAEIEPFPCSLIEHYRPELPNLGDVTADSFIEEAAAFGPLDLLVAGSPCQAFSVAGLRKSLEDNRGNLTLRLVEVVHALKPRSLLWENVPGVLSTHDNAFGCFLAGLVGADEAIAIEGRNGKPVKWTSAGVVAGPLGTAAWRIMDAQYFGLAQRRARLFLVFCSGDGTDPAEVLFEFESMRRDSPPSRETRERVAGTISARTKGGGGLGTDFDLGGGLIPSTEGAGQLQASGGQRDVCGDVPECPRRGGRIDGESETFITVAYRTAGDGSVYGEGSRTAPLTQQAGQSANIIAFDPTQITSAANRSNPQSGDPCHTLAKGAQAPAIAFTERGRDGGRSLDSLEDLSYALTNPGGGGRTQERNVVTPTMAVRRLLPVECEKLQGYQPGYTLVPHRKKPAADSVRYRSIGNSMAVPVLSWLGHRIAAVMGVAV